MSDWSLVLLDCGPTEKQLRRLRSKVNQVLNRISDVTNNLTLPKDQLLQVQAWHVSVQKILLAVRMDKPTRPFTRSPTLSEAHNLELGQVTQSPHVGHLVGVDNTGVDDNLVGQSHLNLSTDVFLHNNNNNNNSYNNHGNTHNSTTHNTDSHLLFAGFSKLPNPLAQLLVQVSK